MGRRRHGEGDDGGVISGGDGSLFGNGAAPAPAGPQSPDEAREPFPAPAKAEPARENAEQGVAASGGEAAKLNPEQIAAVEHEGGPLTVLAGPGTGKTRVIAHRIEHMIRVRGIAPEQIVAVTYTVKAARQLRDRLAGLVGPEADGVHAHTFHGLGLRIVRRFADEIGISLARLNEGGGGGIVDSAQQRRALREIVLAHGLFPRARAAGVDTVVERIGTIGQTLADAAIAPEEAIRFAEAALQRLACGENSKGGRIDPDHVAGERGGSWNWARRPGL